VPNASFGEFWQTYPRRVGKRTAEKAWESAVHRADPFTVLLGARAFAAFTAGKDIKFVAHPTTWLNRDGWDDDLAGEDRPIMPRGADTTRRTLARLNGAS
jgi:hypothetical protein